VADNEQLPADLPQHARERLADMRRRKLFTSDLSVSEFVLVREAGFDPVGLVMGTSIYQVAPKIPRSTGAAGCELETTTKALYHARELAMNRMEEEAEALGADGIVGVRLTVNLSTDPNRVAFQQYRMWWKWAKQIGFRRPQGVAAGGYFPGWSDLAQSQWVMWCQQMGWAQIPLPPWARPGMGAASYSLGANTAEFIAIGTAVRHRDGVSYKNKKGKPFQSDLSGQDFWLLIRAGYRPVGFVMGNCVYYVPPELLQAQPQQSTELHAYTHALYDARELAMERLQDEAEELDATGIVGVTVSEQQHSWRASPWNVGNAALQTGEIIELFVIGTAVVPTDPNELAGAGGALGKPTLVLSANDVSASGGEDGGGE
jgi:uncharacterized protein YbjQ (UPF0145 family)